MDVAVLRAACIEAVNCHFYASNESVIAGGHSIDTEDDLYLEFPSLLGGYHLTFIYRVETGIKGRASELLKVICEWADANNITLSLYAKASGDLKQDQLVAWYERNGFADHYGIMIRKPRQ